jgi:hypothetical protein
MQIQEITIRKDLKYVTKGRYQSDMLASILETHGWHIVGTGLEAAVAEHPAKAYVLKIFNSDSKYIHFVNFVKSHANNPHLPIFSRYVRPVPGTPFSYVRMEKLTGISVEELVAHYSNYLVTMAQLDGLLDMTMLHYSLEAELTAALKNKGWDPESPHLDYDHMYELLGGYPPQSWQMVIKALAEYAKAAGYTHWDLHAKNFLTRGNTLVIADPFV